jgi:predicted alpha/beta superfamily hydrolase
MKNYILSVMSIAILILLSAGSSNQLFGQINANTTFNQHDSYVLESQINETTYKLEVSLPLHYSADDTLRYPVLFILDGNIGFPIAHSVRSPMDLIRSLEDVIIVGIEYDVDRIIARSFANRWKDFTLSNDPAMDNNPAFLNSFGLSEGDISSGGASDFLNILKNEILPFIDEEYKTTGDRGITGHSISGLFVSYALFTAPELFSRYGINSPSFWWGSGEIFNIEKTFSEQHQDLSAQVFLSVGSMEGATMTSVMTAFADSLNSRNYDGLELTVHTFEDEGHMSVIPAMISRTLRVLYRTRN